MKFFLMLMKELGMIIIEKEFYMDMISYLKKKKKMKLLDLISMNCFQEHVMMDFMIEKRDFIKFIDRLLKK